MGRTVPFCPGGGGGSPTGRVTEFFCVKCEGQIHCLCFILSGRSDFARWQKISGQIVTDSGQTRCDIGKVKINHGVHFITQPVCYI